MARTGRIVSLGTLSDGRRLRWAPAEGLGLLVERGHGSWEPTDGEGLPALAADAEAWHLLGGREGASVLPEGIRRGLARSAAASRRWVLVRGSLCIVTLFLFAIVGVVRTSPWDLALAGILGVVCAPAMAALVRALRWPPRGEDTV